MGLSPAFVALAVNETLVPGQIVDELALMLNDGTPLLFTVMVIELEVAVAVVTQVELDVITQVTTCPLVSDVVVNIGLLVPAFTPFTFHW